MNVLQHTRNELNLCLEQNRPDRFYRDTLLRLKEERSLLRTLSIKIGVLKIEAIHLVVMPKPIIMLRL